jgi:hypothetical protein
VPLLCSLFIGCSIFFPSDLLSSHEQPSLCLQLTRRFVCSSLLFSSRETDVSIRLVPSSAYPLFASSSLTLSSSPLVMKQDPVSLHGYRLVDMATAFSSPLDPSYLSDTQAIACLTMAPTPASSSLALLLIWRSSLSTSAGAALPHRYYGSHISLSLTSMGSLLLRLSSHSNSMDTTNIIPSPPLMRRSSLFFVSIQHQLEKTIVSQRMSR